MTTNKFCLVIWSDKRTLAVISNMTELKMLGKKRLVKGGEKESIKSPVFIEEHRQHMGGVDHFDQRIQYYAYPHKYESGGNHTYCF